MLIVRGPIARERLHAFTEPEGERYRMETLVERGGTIAPRAFRDALIGMSDILVPRG